MKKLIVVAPYDGELEHNLLLSSLFVEHPENHFVYNGSLDAHDQVSILIGKYHFKHYDFIETEGFYRFRVFEE